MGTRYFDTRGLQVFVPTDLRFDGLQIRLEFRDVGANRPLMRLEQGAAFGNGAVTSLEQLHETLHDPNRHSGRPEFKQD